ncbi:MAG: hypothetical protein IIC01_05170 [Planctomycetes bacterium]|nr:hypothetical protein [Planctomycetota bacterium]
MLDIAEFRISRIEIHLATAKSYVGYLDFFITTDDTLSEIADDFDDLIKACAAIEQLLWTIESLLHPILIARNKGDAVKYDRIISKLLDEIAPDRVFVTNGDQPHIRILPIMCHKLKIDSAAKVFQFHLEKEKAFYARQEPGPVPCEQETQDVAGVLCIFPSIWSFTTITLLLHEIGHIVWDHCIPAIQKQAIIRLILRAFPHAFPNERPERLWSEIAADAFASLVGGYAFGASLCGFFIAKKEHWTRTAPGYLDIGDRIGLVQRACAFETPNCPGRNDSYWYAIESLKKHLDGTQPNTESKIVHQQRAEDDRIDELIEAFKKSLLGLGVKLASTVEPPSLTSTGERPTIEGETIRQSLVTAAMFREKCKDDDGTDYMDWEKEALPAIS